MKQHSKTTYILISLLALVVCYSCHEQQTAVKDETALKKEINLFVDQWHKDAANANPDYFTKIADGGIFIGTDKTEHWTKEAFQAWSKKFFDKGKAWSFKATERNIYFATDASYAWFDELLDTQMGTCRSSGVLRRTTNGWEIKHYQLSIAVPNDISRAVTKMITAYEKDKPSK